MGALIALPVAFEQAVARAVVRNCPIYFVSSFSARAPGGRSFFLIVFTWTLDGKSMPLPPSGCVFDKR